MNYYMLGSGGYTGCSRERSDSWVDRRDVEAVIDDLRAELEDAKTGDAVKGREAEQLRRGIEKLLDNSRTSRGCLQELLDKVDARDSVAYLEAQEAELKMLRAWRAHSVEVLRGLLGRIDAALSDAAEVGKKGA